MYIFLYVLFLCQAGTGVTIYERGAKIGAGEVHEQVLRHRLEL